MSESEPLIEKSTEPTPAELRFGSSWKMIIPFALLPLAIVSGVVAVFFLFGRLAENSMSADSYLTKLKSTSSHQRWQAAYELSSYLARGPIEESERKVFETEMLEMLKSAGKNDTKMKTYLLVGLGQVGSARSADYIMELANDDADKKIQIYALWALGRIGDKRSRDIVASKLNSKDAGIRKTAAHALGFVGTEADTDLLKNLLEDSTRDVRWNAALALAQLGDPSGQHELLYMLDEAKLTSATPNLRRTERSQIQLSAVNAVGKLNLLEARAQVEKVAESATDPAVRNAARTVLARMNGKK